MREANYLEDSDIKATIEAAKQRAQFDKVGEMLRKEFTEGLLRTNKYSEEKIADVVPKIVDTTNDTRHRGLIDHTGWDIVRPKRNPSGSVEYTIDAGSIPDSEEFTNIFLQLPSGGEAMVFGKSFLHELIPYAQVGCAQAILRRLEPLRQRL